MRLDRPLPAWQYQALELLVPRLPLWARRLLGRVVLRLPLGSRARRWWARCVAVAVWDATARGRDDLYLAVWDPDCEWHWHGDFVGLGFHELYRGHEGVRRSVENWNALWTDRSFVPQEVLDGGGDTFLMRVTLSGRGVRSGVPAELQFSSVARLDPLIVEFHNFQDDDEALRKAGFALIPRPVAADQ
jgi:hypothetical protein